MCVQQLSPAWKGAGKLAAPPVLLLAWSCSMPGDERGPSPAGSNDPGCVQTRCPSASLGSPSPAWLPAKIWGWRPRGEAWVCAAPKRAAKVVRRSVQPETPSHDLCALGSLPGSGSPMPHIQDVMSWAIVPPEKNLKKSSHHTGSHKPKDQQHRGAPHTWQWGQWVLSTQYFGTGCFKQLSYDLTC